MLGNVDGNEEELRAAIESHGQHCHHRFGSLTIAGRNIAFLHSDNHQKFQGTIASQEWDLVCYGHTHQAEYHFEGKTLVLNPGAIYRANPHSLAVVKLPELEVTSVPF